MKKNSRLRNLFSCGASKLSNCPYLQLRTNPGRMVVQPNQPSHFNFLRFMNRAFAESASNPICKFLSPFWRRDGLQQFGATSPCFSISAHTIKSGIRRSAANPGYRDRVHGRSGELEVTISARCDRLREYLSKRERPPVFENWRDGRPAGAANRRSTAWRRPAAGPDEDRACACREPR